MSGDETSEISILDRLQPSRRALWRNKNFAVLFVGQSISQLGNNAYQVALAWAVYQKTHSTVSMSAVLATGSASLVLMGLPAGYLADRFSRRLIMMAADGTSALVTLFLAIAGGANLLSVPVICACAATLGVANACLTPAFRASLPETARGSRHLRCGQRP